MITLPEFKLYLNIEGNEQDAHLQECIAAALSQLENSCRRKFVKADYEKFFTSSSNKRIYLPHTPINSISALQYMDNYVYTDLLTAPDTISNSVSIQNDTVILVKDYCLFKKDIKIAYNGGYKFVVGSAAIKILAGFKEVIGVGSTLFTTEIAVGDLICFSGFSRKVVSIESDTSLTVDESVLQDSISVPYTISNAPHDLRHGIKGLAAALYMESPAGNNLLLKRTETNGTSGNTVSYKDYDTSALIKRYKYLNV